ncbi:MAG TPA: DegV family protein [Bacilli bacterium]|nr:DegV family protein [Bacilli bacterium]
MRKFVMFVDSGCDLPVKYIEKYDFKTVALTVTIEEEVITEYFDEAKKRKMWDAIRDKKNLKTSLVNVSEFIEGFSPYLEQGYDIFYMAISSGLSGTFNAARMAKLELEDMYPERTIKIVDSLSGSLAEGLLAIYAKEMLDEGMDWDLVEEKMNEMAVHMHHFFVIDDLWYIRRGGRLSGTKAFVASLLKVKPVCTANLKGEVTVVERHRGRKKALARIIEIVKEKIIDPINQIIGIGHGDDEKGAKEMKDALEKELGVKNTILTSFGPIIGIHGGPGNIALFFLGKKREE